MDGPRAQPQRPAPRNASSSLADLTAKVQRTTGERPPPLVGCSLTLLNDEVYVFGGRLVPTRTMVSSLYSLNLTTLSWTLLWPPLSPDSSSPPNSFNTTSVGPGPSPRYFHSAEAFGTSKIVFFGGESYQPTLPIDPESDATEAAPVLLTLGDVFVWDTTKKEWEFPEVGCAEGVELPIKRYAHLASVLTATNERRVGLEGVDRPDSNVMVVIGGQDVKNSC